MRCPDDEMRQQLREALHDTEDEGLSVRPARPGRVPTPSSATTTMTDERRAGDAEDDSAAHGGILRLVERRAGAEEIALQIAAIQ